MDSTVEALLIDLLDWLSSSDRTYEEVMEAWRTSCPKLPVWEEANDRGLVAAVPQGGRILIKPTPAGIGWRQVRSS